jgi:hypothetical protein
MRSKTLLIMCGALIVSTMAEAQKTGSSTANTAAPTVAISARAQQMLSSFEAAFPDKKFKVEEKNGSITVSEVPSSPTVISNVPASYNPDPAAKELANLQKTLADETDDKRKLEIAYRLKAAVATQSAAKYQQYVNQADMEAGVPDLIQSVANNRRLDSATPHVVAAGGMSMQTDAAIKELQRARVIAAGRVRDLMATDPVLLQASTLADLAISRIKDTAALGAKSR